MMTTARLVTGLVFTLVAAYEVYSGIPVRWGLGVWFLLALGIGLLLARWQALLLAAIPWPLGIGVGLITGRYAFLGEGWQLPAFISLATGLLGIAAGLGLAHWFARRTTGS